MSPCHNIPLISSCHLRESDRRDKAISRDHIHLRQLGLVNYPGRDGRLMPLKTIWCNSDPSPAHSHVKSAKMLIREWLNGMDIRRSTFSNVSETVSSLQCIATYKALVLSPFCQFPISKPKCKGLGQTKIRSLPST